LQLSHSFNYESHHVYQLAYTNSTLLQPTLDSAMPISFQVYGHCGDWWSITSIFGHIFTAHAQKLLFLCFRSQFWHLSSRFPKRWIRRSEDVFSYFHYCIYISKIWHISFSGILDLMTLNMCHT